MSGTLVLGLGNDLLSDEGAGIHVVRRLAAQGLQLPDVEFMDGGTLSFTLAPAIEDAAALIVVDTAELNAEPGTVRVFEGTAMDAFVMGGKKTSVHEVNLADLLSIARLQGALPERRALVGVQPQTVDWGTDPSASAARAIPVACTRVTEILERWRT